MIRPEIRTRDAVALVANLLGWELKAGEVVPPHDLAMQLEEDGACLVKMVIDEAGIIFEMPSVALVGLWADGVFCLYEAAEEPPARPEVCATSVEGGLAFLCGIRWAMQRMGVNSITELQQARRRASRLTKDDLMEALGGDGQSEEDEIQGGYDNG